MPARKKTYPRRGRWEEQKEINFAWVRVTALQMGMTIEDAGLMYVGEFRDMTEEYKRWHNLRVKQAMFSIDEQIQADPNEVLK